MTDLDVLADLPDVLRPIGFLIGTWQGAGVVGYPTMDSLNYGQEIVFSYFGKPVLAYTSRTWAIDDGRPLAAESGFWRPQPGNELEVLLAHPTGIVEVFHGSVDGAKIEIATDAVARTRTAKEVNAEHRLYGLVEGELMYAADMAAVGQPMQSHLSARLKRA